MDAFEESEHVIDHAMAESSESAPILGIQTLFAALSG
jgi:hypothetical protein